MAAPISTFLKNNNWNCMTPASTFLFPFEYTVWALPWSSIVCLEKINLNADFVYQIEFMHKAMCTYIFWHLFFCACGPSQHFHHHSCAINFSKHWYLYCVQNVLGYSMCSTVIILYQMILRVFFIYLFAIDMERPCLWSGGYARSHNLASSWSPFRYFWTCNHGWGL